MKVVSLLKKIIRNPSFINNFFFFLNFYILKWPTVRVKKKVPVTF